MDTNRSIIVSYPTDDNDEFVYVEVDEIKSQSESGIIMASKDEEITKISTKFSKALTPIKHVTNNVLNQLKELADSPEEVNIEFGLKLNLETGAVIAKVSSECNLKVNIKWKKGS